MRRHEAETDYAQYKRGGMCEREFHIIIYPKRESLGRQPIPVKPILEDLTGQHGNVTANWAPPPSLSR